MRVLGEILERDFGDRVTTKHIDVVDDNMDQYPEVEDYLRRAGMQLPLLVINGKIIRPGTGLNYKEIVEELEAMGFKK
ncbi:MAG: hypothetical protein CVU89_16515 [Firmicutes bacterium HGW-Firmicutes-14]|nr:MAG: hypothetical protein CVU89_16515 [Firmicutes bacterium HGW-Firmicutes-14]